MTQLLSNGSRGLAVRNLQTALALAGFKVQVDGDFGDNTEAVVRDYQRKVGRASCRERVLVTV